MAEGTSMKRSFKSWMAAMWTVLMLLAGAQAETVKDLVEQMPLASVQDGAATYEAMLELGTNGLAELAGMLRSPEDGGDAQARYLVNGTSYYAARPGADEARMLVEGAWLSALEAADHREIRAFLIRQLQRCGTASSFDALVALLRDSSLTEPASQALLTLKVPGTGEAFLAALNAGQGNAITLVQGLGILEYAEAAPAIRLLAESEEPIMRTAALDALAAIGPVKGGIRWDDRSFDLLAGACQSTNRFARSHALGLCLRYADRAALLGAGKQAGRAVQAVLAMTSEGTDSAAYTAALAALVRVDRDVGLDAVVESIHGDDLAVSVAGVKLLTRVGGDAEDRVVSIILSAPPHVRAAAMDALSAGASGPLTDAVLESIGATNSTVQVAALSAAARLADREDLPSILPALSAADASVQAAIELTLLSVAGAEDLDQLASLLKTVTPAARVTLLNVLGTRRAAEQWSAVVAAATDPDEKVRKAAYSALKQVGTTAHLPELVSMALSDGDPKLKRAAEVAIVSIAAEEPDTAKRSVALLDAYRQADATGRIALLRLLPRVAGQAALDQVVAATRDAEPEVRDAGLEALAAWPKDSAAEAMLTALRGSLESPQRVRLMRGLVRMVSAGKRSDDAKLALYRDMLLLESRVEEQNMVLGAVARIRSRAALDLAGGYLDDPALQDEAARVVALVACPDKKYPGLKDKDLWPVLAKAADVLDDEALVTKVEALMKTLPQPPPPNETGFVSLFNGQDLDGWTGDTNGYVVRGGNLVCKPGGNLYTEREYADFVLRFEFKLTPGANNGLGIRTPLGGNAYSGMELQILDNTAAKYNALQPWQYHGSIYGLVAAKRGHLKPVGEWNMQEVTADGSKVKVVLNGRTIVDADLATLEESDDIHAFKKHPGMHNAQGHIGFLGHGSVVELRNVRVRELGATPPAAAVPPEGFVALFNGKDLTGWKGLLASPLDNPIKRAALAPEALAKAQADADADMHAHWKVVDGALEFDGKGRSLCTAKDYGDFELLVDWKIKAKGDSGIYLRGSPQVQIWDPAQHKQGSGGLFNNQKNPRHPTAIADNPIEEWNTFRIKMVGDKVTVHLNDQLVTDNVTMENYWDRNQPMFPSGQIELQNHGNTLWFRNVFIREL